MVEGLIHSDKNLTEEEYQVLRDLYLDRFVQLSDRALKLPAYSDPTLAAYHEPKKDGDNVDKLSTGQD